MPGEVVDPDHPGAAGAAVAVTVALCLHPTKGSGRRKAVKPAVAEPDRVERDQRAGALDKLASLQSAAIGESGDVGVAGPVTAVIVGATVDPTLLPGLPLEALEPVGQGCDRPQTLTVVLGSLGPTVGEDPDRERFDEAATVDRSGWPARRASQHREHKIRAVVAVLQRTRRRRNRFSALAPATLPDTWNRVGVHIDHAGQIVGVIHENGAPTPQGPGRPNLVGGVRRRATRLCR